MMISVCLLAFLEGGGAKNGLHFISFDLSWRLILIQYILVKRIQNLIVISPFVHLKFDNRTYTVCTMAQKASQVIIFFSASHDLLFL